MAYKKDQGRMARMVAFWSLALLLLYGSFSLYSSLATWGWSSGFATRLVIPGVEKLPVFGWKLNYALLIAVAFLATAWWLLFRWQQTPKVADLLIDTETELTKVTWPTMSDAVNSSLVVMGVVMFLMVFMAGADWLLGLWTTRFLVGQ